MPAPLIDLRDVTRVYHMGEEEVWALAGVSLTIDRGEFVAIVGASGSGKSTLMSIIGCLDMPTSGQCLFEGRDIAQLSDADLAHIRSRRIGFVFQSFNLLPHTRALENVELPLVYADLDNISPADRETRALAALHAMGLDGKERNLPGQLSGGQQQRVAIARALINEPGVILADEPTGNLDTVTSHDIMERLSRLNRDHGVTIVMVTHEPDIAAFARRVITMRDGRVVEDRKTECVPPRDRAQPGARTAGIDPTQGESSPAGAN
jgi:macrolide transport system ATP-binding/permease protein